jgi:hypothetical protein
VIVAPPPPSRVQVVAQEFSLAPSRRRIYAGRAIIELANFGEDAHDLRLRRDGGTHVWGWPIVQAGAVVDRSVTLPPGRYLLWCSLGDHRALGMVARLLVVPRSP